MFIRRAYAYNLRPVVGGSEYRLCAESVGIDATFVARSCALLCDMGVDWVSRPSMLCLQPSSERPFVPPDV